MTLALSVLDLATMSQGTSSHQVLQNSLELARRADRLGYTRLWYAEHHNMPLIASTTPEIMIALAAQATTRIRVGSGGVMLPNHAPLKVAETFKMLEALYPGRIDLGIGRAPGTDPVTARALRRFAADGADDFPRQLAELEAFAAGAFPQGHPLASVMAMPLDVALPPIWLLGSSGYSAQIAAQLGTGFGFAAHFSELPPAGPMRAYRDRFQPSEAYEQPHAILTLSVIAAETDEEAERLAESTLLSLVRFRTGRPATMVSPEEALAYPYSPLELAVREQVRAMQIVGSPASVKARIAALVAETAADEVMLSTNVFHQADRLRSLELVATAFGLG
jgi:luciferase family oxidoreductase group 1